MTDWFLRRRRGGYSGVYTEHRGEDEGRDEAGGLLQYLLGCEGGEDLAGDR